MTKYEVGELLNIVLASYPNFIRQSNPEKIFIIWYEILKDYDFQETKDRLIEYAKSNKFAPTVSELIDYSHKKYPGHFNADEIVKKVEAFKKDKAQPPNINIRDFLGGNN